MTRCSQLPLPGRPAINPNLKLAQFLKMSDGRSGRSYTSTISLDLLASFPFGRCLNYFYSVLGSFSFSSSNFKAFTPFKTAPTVVFRCPLAMNSSSDLKRSQDFFRSLKFPKSVCKQKICFHPALIINVWWIGDIHKHTTITNVPQSTCVKAINNFSYESA